MQSSHRRPHLAITKSTFYTKKPTPIIPTIIKIKKIIIIIMIILII